MPRSLHRPLSLPVPPAVRLLGLGVGLLGLLGEGCVPAPRAPIDLQRAETKLIRLGLRHPRSAICPGEPVELDISLDVQTDSGETFHLVPRRVDIDDAIFDPSQLYLSSPQGLFEDGTFYPAEDARKSLGTGFVFFARAPRGPAFSVRFPPYYECNPSIGAEGLAGMHGRDGMLPTGKAPVGLDTAALSGGEVQTTIDGGPGGAGPKFTVYVTWVKTADYTKLLAGRTMGDIDVVSFAAPGYPLEVRSRGGRGGGGGRGTQGLTGGGAGSRGGSGGPGGPGGVVEIVVDERFPGIADYLRVDVTGGLGGYGGAAGPGGERARQEIMRKRHPTGEVRLVGSSGSPGPPGSPGPRGAAGHFVIRAGEVASHFAGVGQLAVY